MAPKIRDTTRSRIGSLRGSNHKGLMTNSFPKKVFAATVPKFPNQPPNYAPHIKVDKPQNINILIMRWVVPSGLYFFRMIAHRVVRMSP